MPARPSQVRLPLSLPLLVLGCASLLGLSACGPHPPRMDGRQPTNLETTLQRAHDLALSNVRSRKLAIYTSSLPLGQEQANAFWPIWRNYENNLAQIDEQLAAVQQSYATMAVSDGATAEQLSRRLLEAQRLRLQIQGEYYDRFTKVVGVRLASRWLQIERQLVTITDLRMVAEQPLMTFGELPKAEVVSPIK